MSELSPNSARYWLPRVEAIAGNGLLIPKTIVVPYDHDAAMGMMDGTDWADWEIVQTAVWEAAQCFAGAAFVRTDLSSAKHDGPGSYKVETQDDVNRVLSFTIQDNELKFWPTGPWPTAFLVREFIEIAAPFVAFGGHPIGREWRYFATAEFAECFHFYWPEDAIIEPDIDGWEKLLADMANEPPPPELGDIAVRAAGACPAASSWSVDFAQDVDGMWYLVDMATADTSWHPDHDDVTEGVTTQP